MEILFYLSALCLVSFMVLATYDGFYLHLWKYELFNEKDSMYEHKTHTIRAILFPLIVWLLFIETSTLSLYIGLFLVAVDLVALGVDAYSEKDSRRFMGGLPKWEYIIHLFSNTFHFAAIVLVLATRITIIDTSLVVVSSIPNSLGKEVFNFVAVNAIPGAIILALVHYILLTRPGKQFWNANRLKITCC